MPFIMLTKPKPWLHESPYSPEATAMGLWHSTAQKAGLKPNKSVFPLKFMRHQCGGG